MIYFVPMTTMEKLIAGASKLGLQLNSSQLEQFSIYYQELIDWNKRVNLTMITSYEGVQTKHFLDSLTVTLALKFTLGASLSVIDVGTGAGMPGIPLKILLPDISLVLLEATAKKAAFLDHIKQKLGLDNMEILINRAELAAHESQNRERFDVVLSRALAPLPSLVELTLPFCAVGGSMLATTTGVELLLTVTPMLSAAWLLALSVARVLRVWLPSLTDVVSHVAS